MTEPTLGSDAGFQVAEQLRRQGVPGPWEVLGERVDRYEVYLLGGRAELVRQPVRLEAAGVRLLRPRGEQVGVGFAATSDLSERSIRAVVEDAEASARLGTFPARDPVLPGSSGGLPSVASTDRANWDAPEASVDAFAQLLIDAFDGRAGVRPSFGTLQLVLAESTLANSSGLAHRSTRTEAALEVAVTASGGPEGADPGEYWATPRRATRLDASALSVHVDDWCRKAEEIRHAAPMTGGEQAVVLPPGVLADVLPVILGYRFSGAAQLHDIAPKPGDRVASPNVTLIDDGLLPHALGSSSLDSEGTPQRRRPLIQAGVAGELLLDVLHARAVGAVGSTGNGLRYALEYSEPSDSTSPPGARPTTLVVTPGDLGSNEEIAEVAGEGVWVDQLGYAFPDGMSAGFGGELRLGYRIHRGKIGAPIRGGTVGGLALTPEGTPSLLNAVVGLGRRTERAAHLDAPTIVSRGITVAGVG
jgi:predicted Zn-dependent protease